MKRVMKRYVYVFVIICLFGFGCLHPETPLEPEVEPEPEPGPEKGYFNYALYDSFYVLIIIRDDIDIGSRLVPPSAPSERIAVLGFCSDVYGWEPSKSICTTTTCTLQVQPNLEGYVFGVPFAKVDVEPDSLKYRWFNLSLWTNGVKRVEGSYIIYVHIDSLP